MNNTEIPIHLFKSASEFEKWISLHLDSQLGIWLKIAKKASGVTSITYDEALDIALCYGWIDGQRKSYDESFFIQKFTPRRPKSLWSQRNVAKVTELISSKKMQPSGLLEIAKAKMDGRWQNAYDSQKDMKIPSDFQLAIEHDEKADSLFTTLSKSELYSIAWRLATASTPITRKRRFDKMLGLLKKGEKI